LGRTAHRHDLRHKGDIREQTDIHQPPGRRPAKSMAFFWALGFSHNPQFSDDNVRASSPAPRFGHVDARASVCDFTPKAICDTSRPRGLLTLSCESREEVDGLSPERRRGSTYDKPEDYGFMYTHSFVDPDGHGWGLVHMSAMPAQE
jgi:hypothetical protein